MKWASKSRNSRSHRKRLVVDGDVAYYWKHSAVKSCNKSRKIRGPMPSRWLKHWWADFTTEKSNQLIYDQFAGLKYYLSKQWYYPNGGLVGAHPDNLCFRHVSQLQFLEIQCLRELLNRFVWI
jgi:hypothetical protein